MAVKTPPPPTYSKGFNLQQSLLDVASSGQYDNVSITNGSQKFQLTKFGGSGQTPEAISLQGGGQHIAVTPISPDAGAVTIGAGGKIQYTAQSSLQSGTLEQPITIGFVVIGVAVLGWALIRKKKAA